MSGNKNPFRRIRLVYRQSPLLLKCMLVAVLVVGTITLLTIRFAILRQRQQTQAYLDYAQTLEQENSRLEKSIAELGTLESIRSIAQTQLGLVDPDTEFFTPEN